MRVSRTARPHLLHFKAWPRRLSRSLLRYSEKSPRAETMAHGSDHFSDSQHLRSPPTNSQPRAASGAIALAAPGTAQTHMTPTNPLLTLRRTFIVADAGRRPKFFRSGTRTSASYARSGIYLRQAVRLAGYRSLCLDANGLDAAAQYSG
jgi:hypothetical protein